MPRVPKHPKSMWRSSPLSGLKTPDNLRLPAEVRHHRRNSLARERKSGNMGKTAGNVPSVPRISSGSAKIHSFKQPSEEESNARINAESLLQSQQHTKKKDCISEAAKDQDTSLAIASTIVSDAKSPAAPTNPVASSPRNHIANGLYDDYKDQVSDSDNSSGWSHTVSSNNSRAGQLDDDEVPCSEIPFTTAQTALLFTLVKYQDELHRLFAWLRGLAQIEPDSFTVVDPYDFIQVLSFDGLQREEKSKLDIISRLRFQLTHRPSHPTRPMMICRKNVLLPFL